MAYAASVTTADLGVTGGRRHYLVTVVETGVTGATDEWSFTLASAGLPRVCRVMAVSCVGSGGSATTFANEAGMVTSGSDVYANSATASPIRFKPSAGIVWPDSATLYGQSNANGTATTITTKILIMEGSAA